MDQFDDINSDMYDGDLSELNVDELIQGGLTPSALSPELAQIAALIDIARLPATTDELFHEELMVAKFKEALGGAPVIAMDPARKRRVLPKVIGAKLVIAALAATALSGTAVAAFDGQLPSTFQSTLSNGLAKVGVTIPTTAKEISSNVLPQVESSVSTTSTTSTTGTSTLGTSTTSAGAINQGLINGSSVYGLCTAYSASSKSLATSTTSSSTADATSTTSTAPSDTGSTNVVVSASTAFQELQAYATHKDVSIAALCASAAPPSHSLAGADNGVSSAHVDPHANVQGHTDSNSSTTTTSASPESTGLSHRKGTTVQGTENVNGTGAETSNQSNAQLKLNANGAQGLSRRLF